VATAEALAYDSLLACGRESEASRVMSRLEAAKLAGILTGALLGAVVASRFGVRWPMLLQAAPLALSGLGTHSLGVLCPGYPLTTSGELVFFAAGEALGRLELWRTDGRGRGTARVAPIQPDPWTMVDWRGRLFLSAWDERYGQELWATDGRPEGTVLLADIAPGTASAGPRGFAPQGDALFFSASDSTHGRELWETDGTGGGTRLVADIHVGPGSGLFTRSRVGLGFGDRIFFVASNGASGEELWAYRPR
jgi:ELWxxDGT repeat protein